MTAHELARALLDGPDFYVVRDRPSGDYGETELEPIDTIERLTVWQVDYGNGWSEDLEEAKPANPNLKVREGEVLRLS